MTGGKEPGWREEERDVGKGGNVENGAGII